VRIDLGKTLRALVASIRVAIPKVASLRQVGSTPTSNSTSNTGEGMSEVQLGMVKPSAFNVICVPTIPGPICYEIHRDGYIRVV
jgi:hypothetical protein